MDILSGDLHCCLSIIDETTNLNFYNRNCSCIICSAIRYGVNLSLNLTSLLQSVIGAAGELI